MKKIAKEHTNCRVCGSADMDLYLDLGLMPLANNLKNTQEEAIKAERFPLQVLYCNGCSLSQLSVVVDPEVLFSNYAYRSGVNGGYVKHCKWMAIDLKAKYNLTRKSFHIDIAGNDGTLLKEFRSRIGLNVLNIDPAENLCDVAVMQNEIPSVAVFWSKEVAEKIYSSGSYFGKADLITATNVFAHVDNVNDFMQACKIALKPQGVLVLEFPYIVDFIEKNEFDTVYFEHLSYFGLCSLGNLCNQTGMKIIDVSKHNIHGGTVRVEVAHEESNYRQSIDAANQIKNEDFWHNLAKYDGFGTETIDNFYHSIREIKGFGHKISAFAASAKGNTLLNAAGIDHNTIDYIADETPEKLNKFSPGTGIPIVSIEQIKLNPPDYLIILSWNFKDEIIEKLRPIYKGKFILPIPSFSVID